MLRIFILLMSIVTLLSGCGQSNKDVSYNEIATPDGSFCLLDDKEKIDRILDLSAEEVGAYMYTYNNNKNVFECGISYNPMIEEGKYLSTWITIDCDKFKTYGNISVGDSWEKAYSKLVKLNDNNTISLNEKDDGIHKSEESSEKQYRINFYNGERLPTSDTKSIKDYPKGSLTSIEYEVVDGVISSIVLYVNMSIYDMF